MAGSGLPGRGGAGRRRDRGAGIFFGIVALWLLDSQARTMVERLHEIWDGQRLAPVFAAYRGYSLYPRAGEGPPVGYTYGPASVLAYLPVVVASDPTGALLGAETLTLAYLFGPVLALVVIGARGGPNRPGGAALGLLLFAILARNPALAYSMMSPVHDAVALGFGMLACLPLLGREAAGWRPLALSASLSIVAVLAKQNAAFLLPSLALFCWLAFGIRAAAAYASLLGVIGLVSAAALARAYGSGPLTHYLLGVQSGMPLMFARSGELTRQFVAMSVLPLMVIGAMLLLGRDEDDDARPLATLRQRLAGNPWALPFLVGVGYVPMSLLGAMKMGGDTNSMSYSLYYFAAAGACLVARGVARGVGPSPEPGRRASMAVAAIACAQAVMGQVVTAPTPAVFQAGKLARLAAENPNQVAFRYAREHPGSAYFPWNTLAVLMAEGKLFASEDAILNIPFPGDEPSRPVAKGDFPVNPDYVAFPPQFQSAWGRNAALGQYPDHRKPIRVPGLEKFIVFGRDGAAGGPR